MQHSYHPQRQLDNPSGWDGAAGEAKAAAGGAPDVLRREQGAIHEASRHRQPASPDA